MEYDEYSDYDFPPAPDSNSYDGISEADLDFLKRMDMNDREVRGLIRECAQCSRLTQNSAQLYVLALYDENTQRSRLTQCSRLIVI